MTRYIVETNSGDYGQVRDEVESAYDEVQVIRSFLHNHQHVLEDAPEPQYKGWKRVTIYIGPNVCENCCEPSPEVEVCAQCVEDARLDAEFEAEQEAEV